MDGAGNVYVADSGNNTIRKVTPAGVVTTLAGLARHTGSADGTGSAARFLGPSGVAVDGAGNVYVADTVQPHDPEGDARRRGDDAGGAGGQSGSADGTGSAARFNYPHGVAVDGAGNVYVADTDNHTIRKVTPAGVVTTLAGRRANRQCRRHGQRRAVLLPRRRGGGRAGNVYVADTSNHTIRKVTPAGVVTTLAGAAGQSAAPTARAAPRGSTFLSAWRWTGRATCTWRTARTTRFAR